MTDSLLDDIPHLAVDQTEVNGHRSGPVQEVLPSRKIIQCRMSSVKGTVKTRPLCIEEHAFSRNI